VPAVPESLVKQFHNKEKKPANYPPVCAATAGMLSLPSNAGIGEDARSKPILKEDSAPIAPASSTQGQKAAANYKTIKVDVSLVTVPVFVGDKDGNYVPDLKPSDFHVFEDNVEQKIDRLIPGGDPHNVVLMLDTSNSMGPPFGEVRSDVQNVVSPFVDALRAEDRVMLVSFDDRVIVRSEFTSDHEKLRGAFTLVPSSPPTRLYDAIDLVKTARLDGIPGRKAMILVTDGVDTRSRLADSVSTLKGIEEGNVLIYVIQCDTKSEAPTGALTNVTVFPKSKTGWIPLILPDDFHNQDERYAGADKYLYDLSKGSGGELYFAATIDNVKDILTHVAEELGHEYTICYYPSNATSSALYRRIHVTVDAPGVTIRARPGYRAGWAP
jgi:VWFA-related protein